MPAEVKQHRRAEAVRKGQMGGMGQLSQTILQHFSKVSVLGGKRPGILIDRVPPEKLPPKIKRIITKVDSEMLRVIYGFSTEPEAITFSTSNWNNPDGPTFTITKDEPHLSRMIKLLSGDWHA